MLQIRADLNRGADAWSPLFTAGRWDVRRRTDRQKIQSVFAFI